jgi:hypothetical protein
MCETMWLSDARTWRSTELPKGNRLVRPWGGPATDRPPLCWERSLGRAGRLRYTRESAASHMGPPSGRSNHTEDIHFVISRAVLRGDEQSLSWLSAEVRTESVRALDLPRHRWGEHSPPSRGRFAAREGDPTPKAPLQTTRSLRVSKRQLGTQGLHGFGTWLHTPHDSTSSAAEQLTSGRERSMACTSRTALDHKQGCIFDLPLLHRRLIVDRAEVKVERDAARGTNGVVNRAGWGVDGLAQAAVDRWWNKTGFPQLHCFLQARTVARCYRTPNSRHE